MFPCQKKTQGGPRRFLKKNLTFRQGTEVFDNRSGSELETDAESGIDLLHYGWA